jgi:hypothetical protein
MVPLARLCALLILAFLGIAGFMMLTQDFEFPPRPPRGIGAPILGIELAQSPSEARAVFRDPVGHVNRGVFRLQVYADWFFICALIVTAVWPESLGAESS